MANAHMCEVKRVGRRVQILFSGRGIVKNCSGREINCFIKGGGREGDFSPKNEPTRKTRKM